MVPPPPPAPPPPVGLQKSAVPATQSKAVDRSALLSQIHQGAKLKKAVTNDRSAPVISGTKSTGTGKDRPGGNRNELSDSGTVNQNNGPVGQLGGLFAQGMPKLKPTNRSFLDGGTYKSQLTPRLGLTSRTAANLSTLSEKPDFKTRISVSQPNTPQIQRQKPYGRVNGIIVSHDNLNLPKMSPSKISPITLRSSNDSVTTASIKETGDSTSVPVSNFRRDLTQQSYLHQTDSSKWGGSDPNLTLASPVKPRSSSKPLPPPKSDQVLSGSNVSVSKPWSSGRSRSFEEDKVEKTSNSAEEGKSGFLNTPRSLAKNPSEPSELHKLQNRTAQPSMMHSITLPQKMSCDAKNIIKPSGAPPPLPSKPPMQMSPQPKNFRQPSSGSRGSHLAHPPAAPPPPPPPRVISQTNTSQSKSLHPTSGVEMKSLPPVPQVSKSKNHSFIPPASETSLSHSSETNHLHTVSAQPPAPPLRNITRNVGSNSSDTSRFESRFQGKFHDVFELPRPGGFEIKKKVYPSLVAKQKASNNGDRSRLPPPVAPPPPPPTSV